jgi:hypothetical protein
MEFHAGPRHRAAASEGLALPGQQSAPTVRQLDYVQVLLRRSGRTETEATAVTSSITTKAQASMTISELLAGSYAP